MDQSQSIPTSASLPPCSICGAGPEKRKWCKPFVGGYGAGLVMLIVDSKQKRTWLRSAPKLEVAKPVVCTQCGYVQFFVKPEDFRDSPPS
jgi:hypothetical protein